MRQEYVHTISGLEQKREELRVRLGHMDAERKRLLVALGHIDGALKVFVEPEFELPRYVRSRVDKNAFFDFLREYLQRSNGPVTTGPIARLWIAETGGTATPGEMNRIRTRISHRFAKLVEIGDLLEVEEGYRKAWIRVSSA